MSRTLSMNNGSVDSLKLSDRCLEAERLPDPGDGRLAHAHGLGIDRVDQCVAPSGLSSKVFMTTASTFSSVIVRGAPGRDSSSKPSKRSATKRRRHFPTMASLTES